MGTEVGDEARIYSERLKLTTGDRYRLFRKTSTWTPGRPKEVTGEFANKQDRLSKLLTRATRDLSAVTDTPQGNRGIIQIGGSPLIYAAETTTSTHKSATLEFFIDDDVAMLSAALNYKITGYRDTVRSDAGIYDIFYDGNPSGALTITLDGFTIHTASSVTLDMVNQVELLNPLQPGWHILRISTTSGRGTIHPTIVLRTWQA